MLVTSSREMRRLNQRFRQNDTPTDVLSFPAISAGGNGFAGDIAISADIAAENAQRLGHSAAAEIKILALHGVLHLAGYDHERDHGRMAGKEARLRRILALPVALIERNGDLPQTHKSQRRRTARRMTKAARRRSQRVSH